MGRQAPSRETKSIPARFIDSLIDNGEPSAQPEWSDIEGQQTPFPHSSTSPLTQRRLEHPGKLQLGKWRTVPMFYRLIKVTDCLYPSGRSASGMPGLNCKLV